MSHPDQKRPFKIQQNFTKKLRTHTYSENKMLKWEKQKRCEKNENKKTYIHDYLTG